MAKQGLDEKIIEIGIAIMIVAMVLVPMGIAPLLALNYTTLGITEGTSMALALEAVGPVALISVLIGLLAFMKKK